MFTARALGADWVWLADDDGRPGTDQTLATLLMCAGPDLDVVSPLVVDDTDPERLAFPLRQGLSWASNGTTSPVAASSRRRAAVQRRAVLVPALDAVGVPDARLFIRGDEVEIHRRLVRSGLRFGTCVRRPTATRRATRTSGRSSGAGCRSTSRGPRPRAVAFRNQGYLTSQPGMRWRRWPDEARYAWYYLVQRDPKGWRTWQSRTAEGRREQFSA